MLPYTKQYFLELIKTGTIKKIKPSDTWYMNRQDYSIDSIGIELKMFKNDGFRLLQGASIFKGKILGGCIDSIYDFFSDKRFKDQPELCKKYNLFPNLDDWKNKILLLETSEERPTPDHYKEQLMELKNYGLFNVINGVLLGKPYDEEYKNEYEKIIVEVIDNKNLPIVSNANIGHNLPRCIIPFGIDVVVDTNLQEIAFKNNEKQL